MSRYTFVVASNWWLRSPYYNNSNNFCYVNNNGNSNNNNANNTNGVAFGFCTIMPDTVIPIFRNEISASTKGAYDLSARINGYFDVVYRTLLALPVILW